MNTSPHLHSFFTVVIPNEPVSCPHHLHLHHSSEHPHVLTMSSPAPSLYTSTHLLLFTWHHACHRLSFARCPSMTPWPLSPLVCWSPIHDTSYTHCPSMTPQSSIRGTKHVLCNRHGTTLLRDNLHHPTKHAWVLLHLATTMDSDCAYAEHPRDHSQDDSLSHDSGAQDVTLVTWPEKQRRLRQGQERLHSD